MSDKLQQLTPSQLMELLKKGNDIELIDVRTAKEHEQLNLGGILIPLEDIMQHWTRIPRDKKVILYCKMGIRSSIAIQRLQERHGFTNLFNLQGGIETWKRALGLKD